MKKFSYDDEYHYCCQNFPNCEPNDPTCNLVRSIKRNQYKIPPYDFHVVCDESNNPKEVIDSNKLVCDIYLDIEK